jgi:co-chaperonin GroES (HSP10)
MSAVLNEVSKITADITPDERSASQLTQPSGHHILLALPQVSETFDSGILKSDKTRQIEEVSSVIGFVLKTGPDAYQNKNMFPSGPWCKEGDFVLVGAYKGTRFKVHGQEFRMINDDDVLGTTEDPRGYSRS